MEEESVGLMRQKVVVESNFEAEMSPKGKVIFMLGSIQQSVHVE